MSEQFKGTAERPWRVAVMTETNKCLVWFAHFTRVARTEAEILACMLAAARYPVAQAEGDRAARVVLERWTSRRDNKTGEVTGHWTHEKEWDVIRD